MTPDDPDTRTIPLPGGGRPMWADEWAEEVAAGDVTCHPGRDMGWTCLGCERVQCNRCDGTDNGSGLCWSCFQTEDPDPEAAA